MEEISARGGEAAPMAAGQRMRPDQTRHDFWHAAQRLGALQARRVKNGRLRWRAPQDLFRDRRCLVERNGDKYKSDVAHRLIERWCDGNSGRTRTRAISRARAECS